MFTNSSPSPVSLPTEAVTADAGWFLLGGGMRACWWRGCEDGGTSRAQTHKAGEDWALGLGAALRDTAKGKGRIRP